MPEHVAYCPAAWPATGHQCELPVGHDGHHDRIITGEWVRWCDTPTTCDWASCDLAVAETDDEPYFEPTGYSHA